MAKAYRWLLDQGITPNHLAIAGDSAGGSLAITTMLRLRELSAPLPLASMPLSPWVDWEHLPENKNNDALVSRATAEYIWRRIFWMRKGQSMRITAAFWALISAIIVSPLNRMPPSNM
jgi:acetyl esterase/lipase